MMKTFYAVLLTAMLMIVLAGCAPQASAAGADGGSAVSGPAITTPGPAVETTSTPEATTGDGVTVTLADNGKTITLKQGERLLLKLGDEYTWDLTISDMNVLSRVKNVMVIRGAQGLYDAAQRGTSVIRAQGDPTCLSEKPACGMPSVSFEATVIVE